MCIHFIDLEGHLLSFWGYILGVIHLQPILK